jgi:hypothetical protein
MAKIRQYFFTLHKSSEDEKLQAVEFVRTYNPQWYMVALEPYTDKQGLHLHVMFQLKCPRSPQKVKVEWANKFKKSKEDIFQQAGKGRWADNYNYITCATAGEHKDSPKILDPTPVVYPEKYSEEVKISQADAVIEDIRHGASLKTLLNAYPKYVLNNLTKIEKFMKLAKESNFIRPNYSCVAPSKYERVPAPWE